MGFQISEHVATAAENEYKGDVQELIAAQDEAGETQLSGDLTVKSDEASKVKTKIQAAARELGRSARVKTVTNGDQATLTVRIRPKRTRTLKPKLADQPTAE